MKHRSIHIFILVAALLVAAPRVSQELSAMKDDLGNCLKSKIFNAFLSLHSADATRPAQPAAGDLLASADATDAAKRTAAPSRSTQVEVHARREVPAEVAEVAAIVEPVTEVAEAEAKIEAPAYAFELHDAKVMRGRELAMIISPDSDVTAPPPPPPARQQTGAARAKANRRRAAGLEDRAASFNVRFDDEIEVKGLIPTEQLRRQLEQVHTLRLDADAARTWTRVIKAKRPAPKPAPAAPAPAARAACPKSQTTTAPVLQIGCGPAAVEAIYASE